ncbi:hypothetical protein B0H16DRAFT_1626674 [Mycena metata]|uniref:Uncharacterized protein n=1 Tax=Mycena metata TaxID=1033252 RepID=A0AAD7H4V5_9AGAR|nr:hypothetical protein B0H16DRAFT_1626674 [Mycena metata]
MPGTASVQLPDLLGLSRAFELRTNRHCHTVTSASETWFLSQQNILTDAEKNCPSVLEDWSLGVRLLPDMRPSPAPLGYRFSDGVGFRAAQMQVLSHRQNNTLPSVEAYVDLRTRPQRPPHGLKLSLDDQRWDDLHRSAIDVMQLSTGAINFTLPSSGIIPKFLAAESAFTAEQPVEGETTPASANLRIHPPPEQVSPPLSSDSTLYLRGLKDCIVGTLNWSYETELYFGAKGDEVRQFGWVFLKTKEQE